MQKAIKLNWNYRLDTQKPEALIHQKLFVLSISFEVSFGEKRCMGSFCSLHTWHSYSPLSLLWTNLICSVHVLEPGEWMMPKRSSFVYNWAPDDNMCQSRLLIQDIWFCKVKSQCKFVKGNINCWLTQFTPTLSTPGTLHTKKAVPPNCTVRFWDVI